MTNNSVAALWFATADVLVAARKIAWEENLLPVEAIKKAGRSAIENCITCKPNETCKTHKWFCISAASEVDKFTPDVNGVKTSGLYGQAGEPRALDYWHPKFFRRKKVWRVFSKALKGKTPSTG